MVNNANLGMGFLFQGAPKPIAIEPCAGNRAAVLTVFLCLPRGPPGAPPPKIKMNEANYQQLSKTCSRNRRNKQIPTDSIIKIFAKVLIQIMVKLLLEYNFYPNI